MRNEGFAVCEEAAESPSTFNSPIPLNSDQESASLRFAGEGSQPLLAQFRQSSARETGPFSNVCRRRKIAASVA